MPKVNPAKKIQKQRTEREMHTALVELSNGTATHSVPPQVDDATVVLNDCIEELLQLRQIREDVRNFITRMQAELVMK